MGVIEFSDNTIVQIFGKVFLTPVPVHNNWRYHLYVRIFNWILRWNHQLFRSPFFKEIQEDALNMLLKKIFQLGFEESRQEVLKYQKEVVVAITLICTTKVSKSPHWSYWSKNKCWKKILWCFHLSTINRSVGWLSFIEPGTWDGNKILFICM